MIVLTAFGAIPVLFQEDKTSKVASVEAAAILGLVVGPPIGTYIYGKTNYEVAFYFYAVEAFICFLICIFLLPENLDKIEKEND